MSIEHTYLRYECADTFGLTTAAGSSSKAPPSNKVLEFLNDASSLTSNVCLTTAGSSIVGWDLRKNTQCFKLGHAERLSGGVGTGRALNSGEVVCLDISRSSNVDFVLLATGWVDGAVRVFEMGLDDIENGKLSHSLLTESMADDEDGLIREPLVLQGHGRSPVRSIQFDNGGARLASGGADGSVVLWDIVAETGLFRLLGHRGAITDLLFFAPRDTDTSMVAFEGLVTTSLDGMVKVWDLQGQCCTQTIASHRGEVLGAALMRIVPPRLSTDAAEPSRWRLVTGCADGQVRVWRSEIPKRRSGTSEETDEKNEHNDDVCHFMGMLIPPPNISTSSEKVTAVHYHPNGHFVGILHANAKDVIVYMIRNWQETQKKRQRRLRRRREKKSKPQPEQKGRKRGLLDDPDESDDRNNDIDSQDIEDRLDPETFKASDEFEYYGTGRASHKVKGFSFVPLMQKGAGLRIVCALSTNALETISLIKAKPKGEGQHSPTITSEKVSILDGNGHPTGIRSVALSFNDQMACTVSKNVMKIWNVASRSCLQSVSPSIPSKNGMSPCYGLCALFLPGGTHVILGTREGHILILDIASGDVIFREEGAHKGAIWTLDVRRATKEQDTIVVATGSADHSVKFWEVEMQDDEDECPGHPMVVQTRTLEMSEDVVAVRYSHSLDSTKRMVFVSSLDSTVKVFFEDSLKFFLSLYGHKLPALAVDAADDDTILASGGADKTIKIWGLDFGDTHRTLYGHEDSITDLKFVKHTHMFFTTSKDCTVRYWDGDRFEQILLLDGHFAEVNCLAISRTGAYVLSGGMDRQVRVWERTKDIVFPDEERERRLEQSFDRVDPDRDGETTAGIVDPRNRNDDDDEAEDDDHQEDQPQSEAAVRRSVLSVAAGDRVMEALEMADQELKEMASFKKAQHGSDLQKSANPLLLGMEPSQYVLWVLRTIKSVELEQSLLLLSLRHMERLVYYLIVLLKAGRGTEICSRVGVFMMKTHQNQLLASRSSFSVPLRELRRLIRLRVGASRDMVGFNLAALRAVARVAQEQRTAFSLEQDVTSGNVWAGMGLGSDVAAALQEKRRTPRVS